MLHIFCRMFLFVLSKGEILAVVGNNGAGKSTLARTLSGTIRPQSGGIVYHGDEINKLVASPKGCLYRVCHAESQSDDNQKHRVGGERRSDLRISDMLKMRSRNGRLRHWKHVGCTNTGIGRFLPSAMDRKKESPLLLCYLCVRM